MKIFVTVGTQDQSFIRLFKMIEEQKFNPNDEVIIQSANPEYENNNFVVKPFFDNYADLLSEADLVICHGGVGTIIAALKLQKKVIAVARLKEYGEHVNDHQCEIVNQYVNEGLILSASSTDELTLAIEKSEEFVVPKFNSNQEYFVTKLKEIIGDLC